MKTGNTTRRLIVNADDFGVSDQTNQAVVRAHREGILTTASLMVNERAAADAIALARENPQLGIGLHLALVHGSSALPHHLIPGLCDARGNFPQTPVATGLRCFFNPRLKAQLQAEIQAQFDKFHATGLPLDHVNGHCHFHLHPVVFAILMRNAARWGIKHIRLTRESLKLSAQMTSGRWPYRIAHALVYGALSRWARPKLDRQGILYTGAVFGLLNSGRIDQQYVCALLRRLPPGDSELYSHPSLDQFTHEFAALVSPENRMLARELGIQLIRYEDL